MPLAKDASITLLGMRSYAPVYGGSMGSPSDGKSTQGNEIFDAFAEQGFKVNPTQLAAYKEYLDSISGGKAEWVSNRYTGAITPEYSALTLTDNVIEPTTAQLAAVKSDYNSEYSKYNDAAIVVLGRPGGEQKEYYTGAAGMVDGLHTTTGNIMGLTDNEVAILNHAKANFDKVIVLLNTSTTMEVKQIQDDPDIDAVLWIGYPGSYGFHGVARVLNGTVSPSAYMGDTYAANSALAPAMMNFGNIPWGNAAGTFGSGDNVNSYLIQNEGIYTGYRYYETRYYDSIVNPSFNASSAKAGTYANADGTVATTDGTWNYANEVVYPFGYGMSYTTFSQEITGFDVKGNKKTATVTVKVTNTGSKSGKSVVQLYAQAPYTAGGVEKSAIQLMDYEKTPVLDAGKSHTFVMEVDMSNLASYDYEDAKTFIVDPGTYYFAIGADSHDALNNILAAQGKTVADGMTANGNGALSKVRTFTWGGGVDKDTFSVSPNNVNITNKLSEGDYAMDINAHIAGTTEYLSRSNWRDTFPKVITGLVANERMITLLKNDFIALKTNDDVSDIIFGDKTSELTITDFKGASFDDPRWEELLNKITIKEFLDFAQNAFHNIAAIPSVGLLQYAADDGPGGSDSHYLQEGKYQGEPWEDAEEYKGYGTRVAPAPINLAYSWNKQLAYENGEIILGESGLIFSMPIMIGPAMNIHRHGWNGRGFEYYSEDPVLSGYTGSAAVQGAQSKGCVVNIKHSAFNDQEINRSGVAVFMHEQKARELELRNLMQAFTAKGKPADWNGKAEYDDTYKEGALGVMSSFNRIGVTAPSANKAVMVDIMREEWGFKGYNVTDFTGVTMKAAPKESILFGTTAFCGMAPPNVSYWNENSFKNDRDMCLAIKQNAHYLLYAFANSVAMNGINSTTRVVWLMTWWRGLYIALIVILGLAVIGCGVMYALTQIKKNKEKEAA